MELQDRKYFIRIAKHTHTHTHPHTHTHTPTHTHTHPHTHTIFKMRESPPSETCILVLSLLALNWNEHFMIEAEITFISNNA